MFAHLNFHLFNILKRIHLRSGWKHANSNVSKKSYNWKIFRILSRSQKWKANIFFYWGDGERRVSHTQLCSELTPFSVFRDHTRWCLGCHMWCWRKEPRKVLACKASTLTLLLPLWPLYLLFPPSISACFCVGGGGGSKSVLKETGTSVPFW